MAFDVLIDQVTPGEWPIQTPGGDMVVAVNDPSGPIFVTSAGRTQLSCVTPDTGYLFGVAPLPTASVGFSGSVALSVGGAADVQAKPAAVCLAAVSLTGSSTVTAGVSVSAISSLDMTVAHVIAKAIVLPGSVALSVGGAADIQAGVNASRETNLSLQTLSDVTSKNIPTGGPTPERTAKVLPILRVAIVPWTVRSGLVPPPAAEEPRIAFPLRPLRVGQAGGRFRVGTPVKVCRYACVVETE